VTLDEILERVRRHATIEDDSDPCWKWFGALTGKSSHPCMGVGRKSKYVRRVIYEALHGVKLTRRDVMVTRCDNADCVAPDHLERISRKQMMRRMRQRGTLSRGPRHAATAAIGARKRATIKLDWPKVHAMRALYAETRNAAEVARRFNVCHSHAHAVCRGKWWREATPWTV
jgi:hypothetical protein